MTQIKTNLNHHVLDVIGSRNERFPNAATDQRIEQMRATHAAVCRRMLELRAFLLPYA